MPKRLIIDTDPGIDDAIAILLALGSPDIELIGLTTVMGNAPLAQTTTNALRILELAGRSDVPVFAGADRPLLRPIETAEAVHGADALGECGLPVPAAGPQPRHAVDWLVETILAEPAGSVALGSLGPMTNIAMALRRAPEIAGRLAGIWAMGGSFFAGGNSEPAIEFNIQVDPHAAAIVFGSGVPITLAPLDLTHRVLMTPGRIAAIAAAGTPVALQVAQWMEFYSRYDAEKFGWPGGPLHDPCAIAALLAPDLFRTRRINVEIELEGRYTSGMTIFDWWGTTGRPANCDVLHEVDVDALLGLLASRIAAL